MFLLNVFHFVWNFLNSVYSFIRPFLIIFAIIVIACVVFLRRRQLAEIVERFRNRRRWYDRMQQSALFEDDLENGLSSGNFDISGNVANDSRKGLDENAKAEIRQLMSTHNLSFDEARLRYFQETLSENGVGSDGVPTDQRTVTFDRLLSSLEDEAN